MMKECPICEGERTQPCDECRGSGCCNHCDNGDCPACDGNCTEECYECNGTGEVEDDDAPEEVKSESDSN